MGTKQAEHERELEEVRRRHEGVAAQLKFLSLEEQELATVMRGWEAIVAMDRKQSGNHGALVQASSPVPMSRSVADSLSLRDEAEEGGENKTQFVRDQIRIGATTGTTPADLKRAATAAGMKYPASWPYGSIQRLKKKGEIIKRKGRFYPNPKAGTSSENGQGEIG